MCNSWLFPWFRSAPFDVVVRGEDNGPSLFSPGYNCLELAPARPASSGIRQGEVFSVDGGDAIVTVTRVSTIIEILKILLQFFKSKIIKILFYYMCFVQA